MIQIKQKKMCNGCHACVNVCPFNAISMNFDDEGFFYPSVNMEACTKCGLCLKTCPTLKMTINDGYKELKEYTKKKENKEIVFPVAYACFNKENNVRLKSSSGGIFSLLADYVLENDGIVFGVGFDSEFEVIHMQVDDKEELYKLRISKYVQSRVGETYKLAKKCLDENKLVLYTGTPCQIGGLYAYLKKNYSNLITQDIICHGVPSPQLWKNYIEYRELEAKSKLKSAIFRNKIDTWKNYSFYLEFQNGDIYARKPFYKDPFMKIFLMNRGLRPSCHSCFYKSIYRKSDLTLADFWGIKKVCKEMDVDDKGTSLILINNQNGLKIIELLKNKMVFKEVPLEPSLKKNKLAYKSAAPFERNAFFKSYKTKTTKQLIKKYEIKLF